MTLHDLFLYGAVLGGALFLVQVVLSLVGAGHDGADLAGHDGGHASSDAAFKVLSLQGLSAFFAMFGLTGLALRDGSGVSGGLSMLGAVIGGVLTTLVIARIFRAAKSLESKGNLDMGNARGAVATVYLRIGPQKPGKVTVTVQGRSVEAEAVSEEDVVLDTGTRVRVVRALPSGVLVVGKL